MTDEQFNDLLVFRLAQIQDVLAAKASEYAKTGRMHNFERGARILDSSPERVLVGFFLKHLVSVLDIVEEIDGARGRPDPKFWNEKIGDAINYLVLLDIMVRSK